MTASRPSSVARRDRGWLEPGGVWLAGVLAGVAVLGPALRPGSLLSLDLVITPRIPVPSGVWGLGPDLPRRVPYGLLLSWGSAALSGPVVAKVLLVAAVAVAFVGATRLAVGTPAVARVGAGVAYALSPFLLTRIGAGHLGVVLAYALLPWAVPALLRPGDRLARTYLWALALACTGYAGGLLALALVLAGLVADRGRRAGAVLGAAIAAQAPWLVPGIVVAIAGTGVADSSRFATRADGLLGWLAVPAGHGFWRASSQVGGTGAGVAVLGAVLLGLALAGRTRLPEAWAGRAAGVAAVGLGLALASAVPGIRDMYSDVTGTAVGAAVRESHRWLPLFLVWMAPAAAQGAARLGGRLLLAVPAACALALAVPGLWGADGRLEPVDFPGGWSTASQAIRERPGTVLALPWHQYLDVSFADGRRVLNPLPDYLGGDVLSSSDPELVAGSQEAADPREPHVLPVLARVASGGRVADDLARIGVRWVVLLHEVDWEPLRSLRSDPGLRRVVADRSLELFEVRAWRGPVVTTTGRVVDVRPVVAPLAHVAPSGLARWHRPAAPGWMRGWHGASESPVGTIDLPVGRGFSWFWPACAVVIAYICTICACLRAGRALQRWNPSVPSHDKCMNKQTGRHE
ncbi:MAG: hypothetical protein QOG87_3524 [Actinomycetota bacterium]